MATVTTIIRKEKDLTEKTIVGEISAADIFKLIEQLQHDPDTKLRLWDFSGASFDSIRGDDVPRFADAMANPAKLQVGGKTAVIVGSELAFGLMRMYETYREIRNITSPFLAARSRQEALDWLLGKPSR